MTSYTGGCQCGQIRYEIQAEPLTLYICHCQECQKQSSSAFGMSMQVERNAVVILQGEPKTWQRVAASGRSVSCSFCANCGTRLFHNPSRNSTIINVKPGTLDDTSWLRPVGQLWIRSKQSWVVLNGEMLCYEMQPSNFDRLIERFHNRETNA